MLPHTCFAYVGDPASRLLMGQYPNTGRKIIVENMYDNIYRDMCRELDDRIQTPECAARLAKDGSVINNPKNKEKFVESIKQDGKAMVDKSKAQSAVLHAAWFNSDVQFKNEITSALELAVLARSKLQVWLEDPSQRIDAIVNGSNLPFHDAHFKLSALRWQRLEAARKDGSDIATMQRRVLEYCISGGWVTDSQLLEVADATGRTPFILQCLEGDYVAMNLPLEAGADPGANSSEALIVAAELGRADMMRKTFFRKSPSTE